MNVQQEIAAISQRLTQGLTVDEVVEQMKQTFAFTPQNDDELIAVLGIKGHLFQAYTDAMKRENGEQGPLPPAQAELPPEASEALQAKDAEISRLKAQLKEAHRREKNYKVINNAMEEELGRKGASLKAAEAENALLKKELAELKVQMAMAKLEGKYEEQSKMLAEAKKELEDKNKMIAELSKK
ncbi:hypothetical protein CAEBREN_17153 [Caenorhabditis brenneri]|uniref:Uncharacterized protein n=1 Tax=Caenorhabditis brenneri TaxID=135651 RepID=G0P4K5_CAEBE|nr:hypothetical protein CAEBREN_17153 [Caenorhabditis brenneri]